MGDVMQGAIGQAAGGGSNMILMLGAMFAIIYFFLLRPQKKQQDEQQKLMAALKKGDEVLLSSGVYGKVYSVEERNAVIEIAKDTRIKVLKSAVAALTAPGIEGQSTSGKDEEASTTAVDSKTSQGKSADNDGKKSKAKKKKSA